MVNKQILGATSKLQGAGSEQLVAARSREHARCDFRSGADRVKTDLSKRRAAMLRPTAP